MRTDVNASDDARRFDRELSPKLDMLARAIGDEAANAFYRRRKDALFRDLGTPFGDITLAVIVPLATALVLAVLKPPAPLIIGVALTSLIPSVLGLYRVVTWRRRFHALGNAMVRDVEAELAKHAKPTSP